MYRCHDFDRNHRQKIIRVYDVRVHIVQVVRSLIEITVRKSLGFMMQGSHVPPFKPITVQVDLMTGHHYVEAIYQRIIFYYSRVGQSQEIHKCFQWKVAYQNKSRASNQCISVVPGQSPTQQRWLHYTSIRYFTTYFFPSTVLSLSWYFFAFTLT